MFSEKHTDNPKQIWLVDPAPKVIEKYEEAISQLEKFMQSHGLECKPEEVNKLRGDEAVPVLSTASRKYNASECDWNNIRIYSRMIKQRSTP